MKTVIIKKNGTTLIRVSKVKNPTIKKGSCTADILSSIGKIDIIVITENNERIKFN